MGEEETPAVESAETPATESAPVEQPTETPAEPQVQQEPASDESESAGPPESVPYSRFKEVNDKLKTYESQQTQEAPFLEEEPQLPVYQPQQMPVDPTTNEIDPVQYAQWIQSETIRQTNEQIQMARAWDKAEVQHPELSDPTFRKAVMGMIHAESVTTGKVVTPSSAATSLKKLTQAAQKQAVQAQNEQVKIQDSVKPLVGGAPVTETKDPAAELKKTATTSSDMMVRQNARLQILKNL